MPGQHTTITSSNGGTIPTYVSAPEKGQGPGVVMVLSIFGLGEDMIEYADELAARGFVATAPNPFWRDEDPGVLKPDEPGRERAMARAQRVDREVNLVDLKAAIDSVRSHPRCNGKVAVMGFCFGGQYAFLGAARLGIDAGIAFHSGPITPLFDELDKIACPLAWHWGDDDHAAPPEELEAVDKAFSARADAELFVYPGGKHGFTMWTNPAAWDKEIRDLSFERSVTLLQGL